jgi:hypothetical protein
MEVEQKCALWQFVTVESEPSALVCAFVGCLPYQLALRGTCRYGRTLLNASSDMGACMMRQAIATMQKMTVQSAMQCLCACPLRPSKALAQEFCMTVCMLRDVQAVHSLMDMHLPFGEHRPGRQVSFWKARALDCIVLNDACLLDAICASGIIPVCSDLVLTAIVKRDKLPKAPFTVCLRVHCHHTLKVLLEQCGAQGANLACVLEVLAKWAAAANDSSMLRTIVSKNVLSPQDMEECLLWAAKKGALQAVKCLVVENGVAVGPAALHQAVKHDRGSVTAFLWSNTRQGVDCLGACHCSMFSRLLAKAVYRQSKWSLQVLLGPGPLQSRFRVTRHLLRDALMENDLDVARVLLLSPSLRVSLTKHVWYALTCVPNPRTAHACVKLFAQARPGVVRLPLSLQLLRKWLAWLLDPIALADHRGRRVRALLPLFLPTCAAPAVLKRRAEAIVAIALVHYHCDDIVEYLCKTYRVDGLRALAQACAGNGVALLTSRICFALLQDAERRHGANVPALFVQHCGPLLGFHACNWDVLFLSPQMQVPVDNVDLACALATLALPLMPPAEMGAMLDSMDMTHALLPLWLLAVASLNCLWETACVVAHKLSLFRLLEFVQAGTAIVPIIPIVPVDASLRDLHGLLVLRLMAVLSALQTHTAPVAPGSWPIPPSVSMWQEPSAQYQRLYRAPPPAMAALPDPVRAPEAFVYILHAVQKGIRAPAPASASAAANPGQMLPADA